MISPPQRIPNSVYHGPEYRAWWSNSMLKDYRKSPTLAYRRYVEGSLPMRSQSSSMIFGSLVHAMLLLPESEWEVEVCTEGGRRSKAFGEAVAAHPEALVVTPEEFDEASAACKSVLFPHTRMGEIAEALLDPSCGHPEYPVFWEERGVPVKAMMDRFTVAMGRPCVIEVKTTQDPSPEAFSRQVWNLGYYVQSALYIRAAQQIVKDEIVYFWICVHNEAPFEVAVYPISSAFLGLGNAQLDKDLDGLRVDLSGEGSWSADWESSEILAPLDPLPWMKKQQGGIYE